LGDTTLILWNFSLVVIALSKNLVRQLACFIWK